MRFSPISEAEADAQSTGLWPDGEYAFEVREATEETSAAGNEMLKLEVYVYKDEGERRTMYSYLVNSPKAAWRIRQFAASCGLLPAYERGGLDPSEIVGRAGRCEIGTEPASNGYPAKNAIRQFIKGADSAAPIRQRGKAPIGGGIIDDEVPFSPCWQ